MLSNFISTVPRLSVLISQALQAQKGIDALSMLTDVVKAQQLVAGLGQRPRSAASRIMIL